MPTLAVYPGSFDPLTNGHVDIITRGARLFDRIVVAILVNSEKDPLFDRTERVDIARAVFEHLPNVEVETFEGLLVDYVERRGAQVIVRVQAEAIFPNCPRYIHRMQLVEESPYAPCEGHTPPVPEWKTRPVFREVLPPGDPATR